MSEREGYGSIKAENLKKEDYPTLMMLACEMHDIIDKTDCKNFVTMTITVDGEYDIVLTIGRAGKESPAEQLERLTDALQKSTDNFESLHTFRVELEAKLAASERRVKALEEALSPSAETKGAFMGEFSFPVEYTDRDGDEISYEEMVPWTTIKKIMQAIRERAEATCQR